MKIRLMGTTDECVQAADRLRQVLKVVEESPPRPNRGDSAQVRVYLEARIPGSNDRDGEEQQ